MPKIVVECTYCGKEFEKWPSHTGKNNFCQRKHRNIWMKGRFLGENNPNFGNKWSDKQKENLSQKTLARVDEKFRNNCSKSNKGKKFSQERINKMHGHRSRESYIRVHSEETKKIIGIKSKKKFEDEKYIKKQRETMEARGHWVKEENISDKDIYYKESKWPKKMWDLIENSKQLKLLKENGVFNCRTNTKGVVRDHIYGRMNGFNNKVFPEILRHPCNCRILMHSNNVSKRSKNNDSDFTIEELCVKIEQYKGHWFEQSIVLEKITQYRRGIKWKRIM